MLEKIMELVNAGRMAADVAEEIKAALPALKPPQEVAPMPVAPPPPSVGTRPQLESEHRELLMVYGDAQARLRSLQKFVADVESKLDASEALFSRLVAAEQQQAQGPK